MPENARILQFPQSSQRKALSSAEAALIAGSYLDVPLSERSVESAAAALSDADIVQAVLARLRILLDSSPTVASVEAVAIYQSIFQKKSLGFFDERDYYLGESALIAGSAHRLLGHREEADLWIDRAEASFRHIVNPAPQLANISYARLALHYDSARYDRALELLPSLTQSFQKLNMEREALKCRFLEAMSLKNVLRTEEACQKLEAMAKEPSLAREAGLHGLVLVNLGDLSTQNGQMPAALEFFQKALPILRSANQTFSVAHLKGLIGEALRAEGNFAAAAQSFRDSIADYVALEMVTRVAYLRIVLSETLIALGRNREAEWEILAALPTIEEQQMVPEGFAAVALLRESVKRRAADPEALQELRKYLHAKN